MGLVSCPDCNKSISDQAPACIHCGRPLGLSVPRLDLSNAVKSGNQRSRWRYEAGNAIGVLGVIISLFIMFVNLPLGILLLVASAGFGLWLAYGS